jgi:hypothetical protein
LHEDVNRLKRMEQAAKNELNALQNNLGDEVEVKESKKGNVEEELDRQRVHELLVQNEESQAEIMRNKEEINGLKIQIMTVLKQ